MAYRGKGFTRDIVILNAAGVAITPGAPDIVRVTIGRDNQTPELTVTSAAYTANGSYIAKGATSRLRIDALDLDFAPGVYTFQVDYYDNADAQEWKMVSKQCFSLESPLT